MIKVNDLPEKANGIFQYCPKCHARYPMGQPNRIETYSSAARAMHLMEFSMDADTDFAGSVAFELLGLDYAYASQGKAVPSEVSSGIATIARLAAADPGVELESSKDALKRINSAILNISIPKNQEADSATAGDYFLANPETVLRCDCDTPVILARLAFELDAFFAAAIVAVGIITHRALTAHSEKGDQSEK